MSTIKQCDKCKKIILTDKGLWDSEQSYNVDGGKKSIKIRKQDVEVHVQIKLGCGDHLDLCNQCAFKIAINYLKKQ